MTVPSAAEMGAVPIPGPVFTRIWGTPLAPDAALHARSGEWASNLRAQMHWGKTSVADGAFMGFADNQCGHPLYVVPDGTPLVPVTVRSAKLWGVAATELDALLRRGVPLPDGWRVGNCKPYDLPVCVYQPSTNVYVEMLGVIPSDPNRGGMASCYWGGVMTDVATNTGVFRDRYTKSLSGTYQFWQRKSWGASATSLPYMAGIITREDVQAGVIPHAISIAVGQADPALLLKPAQRHDGMNTSVPVPEAARFRFPADVDVEEYVLRFRTQNVLTTLQRQQALAFLRAVIVAGRDYGFVVTDQTGGGVTLYHREYSVTAGAVRWGLIRPGYPLVYPFEYMRAMPWDVVEVVDPAFL